jgi:hypothetical protein
LCWHLEPEDITTSQNHLEEALLRRLVQALPQAASPIFLGDRALGRASFLQFLQQLPIDMGGRIEFVVRLKGEVKIEWQGQRWLLQDLLLQRGRVHWLPGVRYRADGAVTVNLVVFWDWQMRALVSGYQLTAGAQGPAVLWPEDGGGRDVPRRQTPSGAAGDGKGAEFGQKGAAAVCPDASLIVVGAVGSSFT